MRLHADGTPAARATVYPARRRESVRLMNTRTMFRTSWPQSCGAALGIVEPVRPARAARLTLCLPLQSGGARGQVPRPQVVRAIEEQAFADVMQRTIRASRREPSTCTACT